ncbi:TM0106 family RecB-like putative nuclease [Microbacterium allomyrinae]|uniref:TM0106 family RecB-like putative nuclease n=1 Tax=Microbacterium allomyrinae TaxID=2830666 RepID=A0A9X1LT45_9MICO|nr:bifunctional RecB family nuclease/DEAD/DEAH box helicase [Microbacterium allomyrinae]MCC2031351.1 TM0106 family RecB-like putative nuclease [Microbacterium allomyrinae]
MRYIEDEGRIVWSASDLKAAAECEFAWLRGIDARLGRVAAVEEPEDLTLERAGRLGTVHERRVLADYVERFGAGVALIPETRSSDAAGLAAAVAATNAALASDADVVYQAAFATSDFVGFADFLVRDPSPDSVPAADGRTTAVSPVAEPDRRMRPWIVQDTKLARHARVTALMQLAAYVAQLDRLGVARSDRVELLLGDGSVSVHEVDDLLPVFELRRERLAELIADRRLDRGAAGEPIAWGDPRGELGVVACGRCATCDAEVVASRDLLLVAGMRPVQRERLRAAEVDTIDALAVTLTAPVGMNPEVFASLRTQARLQLESPAGTPPLYPSAVASPPSGASSPSVEAAERDDRLSPALPPVPVYEVVAPQALGALPRPDHGDLFFDFEGDPLHTEPLSAGREAEPAQWGIDYLFGWVDVREQYTALWAHSFADEKRALETFLDIVHLRRQQHPDMHIYHYAPYEPTHLLAMAARHGVREADVDRLLRDGVFVDLYPVVRRALRVGSRSYSIKKLEPLYMGAEVRTSDVQKGDDSIVRYVEARALLADGDESGGREILDDLADYNRYDCVSTRRLRDWLVDRAREAGLRPSPNPEPDEKAYEPSARATVLDALALQHPVDSPVARSLHLGAAAIDYYPREAKSFWATHFLRLREPVSLWEQTRDVVAIDPVRSRVREDWHYAESGRGGERRIVELRGELAPGTRVSEGANPFALYELPAPYPFDASPRWIHSYRGVKVVEVLDDGAVVEETAVDGHTWAELPVALTPAAPPGAGNQQSAIDAWADAVIAASPELPADPATDILGRRAPRTLSGALPEVTGDIVDAITRAVSNLDRSYLAVQGPPGTGKTYVGSHVIARLVREQGYRVGVVAQGHATVEQLLDRVIEAGVPPVQVGKAPKDPTAEHAFTVLPKNGVAAFAAEHEASGFVVGGTAWDFSHEGRIPRGSLDLLVVDEAGQFSLASTIAVSLVAPRLLLLGDPQQLPQVSQGTHPAPVDTSALGWVMDGADVIPHEYGYFLAQTRRMRPEVAAPVSTLSYRGELAAHPSTALRRLEGIEPGLVPIALRHHGNATQSLEEAAEVARIVGDLVGRAWAGIAIDAEGAATTIPPRPLGQADLIVVTPYNAQQVAVEEALASAGFPDVPVGTVDKFQGKEAAVAIVSLAASSGREAPRGLEFLLLRNRLNVAISRAMHTAYLVYSPGLLDDLPYTPEGVARLSGFARLVGHGGSTTTR